MVNSTEFTARLKKILTHYELSASIFADKIGVQRSSISHILSGRNKPSLDFILKVTNTFTEVDIYWLLNGKGSFPKENKTTPTLSQGDIFQPQTQKAVGNGKKISRIVVFYNDGTFDEYKKD
ncbi:helix-turn-helix transcriptional regulator [Pseudotenacibaculum sp. MALMAid0570]|uniref:helix-turn-helix domain-containing protein n=1 Tax=Pseudotenacibaculum sp. MALMAid0570 TaxID=3143938 RepID=UPI0032DFAD1D